MKHIVIVTKDVVCDFCNKLYTKDDDTKGGILFGSYGTCPECEKGILDSAKKYNEEHFVRERAKEGETFHDFIIRIRKR